MEVAMRPNVGTIDRVIRIVLGLVVCALVFVIEGPGRWLGLIGLVPLLSGILGWCPAYGLFGVSTCPLGRQGDVYAP
jgi:hypothetical protein